METPDAEAAHTVPIQTLAPEPERAGPSIPWTGLTVFFVLTGLLGVAAVPATGPTQQELASERQSFEADLALAELRAAVREYELDHGRPPGLAPLTSSTTGSLVTRSASPIWFRRQLLMNSDELGETVPQELESHPFGPYLEKIPRNPINGLVEIRVIASERDLPAEADGECGWIYDVKNGVVRLNAPGRMYGSNRRYYDL